MCSKIEDRICHFPGEGQIAAGALETLRDEVTMINLQRYLNSNIAWTFREFEPINNHYEKTGNLDHPLALFRCIHCGAGKKTPLTSTTAMHKCLSRRFTPSSLSILDRVPGDSLYKYAAKVVFQYEPWSTERLFLHEDVKTIQYFMELTGVNTTTGTLDDLDKVDPFVQCFSCKSKVRGMTMGWRTAVCIISLLLFFKATLCTH